MGWDPAGFSTVMIPVTSGRHPAPQMLGYKTCSLVSQLTEPCRCPEPVCLPTCVAPGPFLQEAEATSAWAAFLPLCFTDASVSKSKAHVCV